MWFGFGVITLTIAILVGLHTRLSARWRGQPMSHGQIRYELQEVCHEGRVILVRVGTTAPHKLEFSVRAEGMRDRMFKWIGLAYEVQTHDPEFDRTLYIESDARGIAVMLKARPELRQQLLELFRVAREQRVKRMRLRCAQRRLWVEFKPGKDEQIYPVVHRLAPLLEQLRTTLAGEKLASSDLRDPFIVRAAIVLSISTATLVIGLSGTVRAMLGRTDILDPMDLFWAAAAPAVAIATFALIGIVSWIGGSSRAHMVVLEFALTGTFGILLSVYAFAREANMDFDFTPAERHMLSDVRAEHCITRGRRGRTRHYYYLHTRDWRPEHRGEYRRLEISRDDYNRLATASAAIISVKPGALGFAWIESVQPAWPASS